MRNLAHLAAVVSSFVMVGVGCAADTTAPSEPSGDESVAAPQSDDLVVFEYVGEVDVAKNTWSIRPAVASERDPKLATRSWSRITGSGTPAAPLTVATGPLTTGAGTVSPGTFTSASPATDTCVAGQQCGYVNLSQGATGPVPFSAGVAVIYNVTNGVTFANGDTLPNDPGAGTALYQNALPSAGAAVKQYGGVGAGTWGTTFAWGSGTQEARPWKWNLGTATGFTFSFQIWGIVSRTAYPANFTSTTGTFIDACAQTGAKKFGNTLRALGATKAATGAGSVRLDFPISIYDSASSTLVTPSTMQDFDFWVDGSLTGNIGGVGATTSDASSSGTGNLSAVSTASTPNYSIYPYRANFTIASPLTGDLCYAAMGTAPARKAVFTWQNVAFATDTTKFATFSAVLYENSDKIEFQYSSMNAPGSVNARAGIKGDASHYVCRLTAGTNCQNVRTTATSGTFFTLSPSTPTYAGP